MVASRLSDIASKGFDWAYGSSPSIPDGKESPPSASDYYWTYATSSFQSAVDTTSATLTNLIQSLYSKPIVPRGFDPKTQNELGWMLQNPYRSIRCHYDQPSSLPAIRSLLTLVHVKEEEVSLQHLDTSSSLDQSVSPVVSRSETASQLAEGTIRALRDLELDEAMELHRSLQYWTKRWERPLLSWLEAGPWVWLSEEGYNHQLIGQRVSQIQAVLARRCAAIGELQQHLLRAGWQKGVAQWAVLGQGAEWAAVAGFDGAMVDSEQSFSYNPPVHKKSLESCQQNLDRRFSALSLEDMPIPELSAPLLDACVPLYYGHASVFVRKTDGGTILLDDPALVAWSVDAIRVVRDQLYRAGTGLVPLPCAKNWKGDAGELITEGAEALPSTLPVWASREKLPTPKTSETELATIVESEQEGIIGSKERLRQTEVRPEEGRIVVTDLNAMASEVSELLDSMEVVMAIQRNRRLEKLKGLPFIRRTWYMSAVGGPMVSYLIYRLLKGGMGMRLARRALENVSSFINEHLYGPVSAIFNELFNRGARDTISDHKARIDAIESLKKMINSFLAESFPLMLEEERKQRANNMDMSLIEQTKEENMKTIFEINSVVRMSLIEMQFIKKELLNALYAIDDMMTSNEINMNVAAVTPVVLILYGINRVSRFLFYALLKVKKSREEIYSSFRHVMLDIERLLLMRDNPPSAPPPLTWTDDGHPITVSATTVVEPRGPSVLNSDDLGMLMLHIHECRTILWEGCRRFPSQILRDVEEDLAELAGERGMYVVTMDLRKCVAYLALHDYLFSTTQGAVSVEQQLRIIARMFRTYSFLKVISTGVPVL